MILLTPIADPPDLVDATCSACRASVRVPCVLKVDTQKSLDCLLAGTINTTSCPSCGTPVSADRPVHIDMPELGVGSLTYAPLHMLDHDHVCANLLEDNHYEIVFYSLEELARQVRARLRLNLFQSTTPRLHQPL